MANWYANAITGTSGGAGTSWATAKQTLTQALALASTGDTIYCRGEFRNEVWSTTDVLSGYSTKSITWVGVDYCEWNGNGKIPGVWNVGATAIPKFFNIHFTGFSGYGLDVQGSGTPWFFDCVFRDMPIGLKISVAGVTTPWFNRCRFYNCGTGLFMYANAIPLITNCHFSSNGIDVDTQVTNNNFTANFNCFGSPIMIRNQNASVQPSASCDFNVFDFTNGKCQINGVDKTTLASWQAAIGSPRELNSIDRTWRTDIGDYAKKSLWPNPSSYLLTAGPYRNPIGLPFPAVTISNNTNATKWTNGIFSNTQIDSDGNIVLIDPTIAGTFSTDVIDFGAAINVNRIELLGGDEDSSHYFDLDTADSPGNRNIEFRGSVTSFLKTDVSPAWVTIPRSSDQTYIYRYVQIRVTLRQS